MPGNTTFAIQEKKWSLEINAEFNYIIVLLQQLCNTLRCAKLRPERNNARNDIVSLRGAITLLFRCFLMGGPSVFVEVFPLGVFYDKWLFRVGGWGRVDL